MQVLVVIGKVVGALVGGLVALFAALWCVLAGWSLLTGPGEPSDPAVTAFVEHVLAGDLDAAWASAVVASPGEQAGIVTIDAELTPGDTGGWSLSRRHFDATFRDVVAAEHVDDFPLSDRWRLTHRDGSTREVKGHDDEGRVADLTRYVDLYVTYGGRGARPVRFLVDDVPTDLRVAAKAPLGWAFAALTCFVEPCDDLLPVLVSEVETWDGPHRFTLELEDGMRFEIPVDEEPRDGRWSTEVEVFPLAGTYEVRMSRIGGDRVVVASGSAEG
ncbi:MAG: hypothetical protein ACLGIR_01235 [Actinomycetes bacterium]